MLHRANDLPARVSFNRYPSSAHIFCLALPNAIFSPSSQSKFSGLAHALSPIVLNPFVSVMQQTSLILAENEAMGSMDLDSWIYVESVKVETDVYGNQNPLFGAQLVPKSDEA